VTALLAATPGVWVDPIEQAVSLPPEAAGSELGAAVLAAVGGSARIVPHPKQDEWVQRRVSSHRSLRQARVRRWRAFCTGAALVQISRVDDQITVSPMHPLATPQGAYKEVTGSAAGLISPTSEVARRARGTSARAVATGGVTGSCPSPLIRRGRPMRPTPARSEGSFMKRFAVGSAVALAVLIAASAAPAGAAPNPNPSAPEHAGTACANVLSRNPNTGPGGHISDQGGTRFYAVGQALCGLP